MNTNNLILPKTSSMAEYTFSRPQVFMTCLFLSIHLTYFTMAPRILLIFGFPQPGGILIFPFTFMLSDIITEVYSYRYARFLIWCVLAMLGIFTLTTYLSMQISTKLDYGYKEVFLNYPKLYLSISIATFVSFFVNNSMVSKLKTRWLGRFFWIRALLATAVGHALFSAIWVLMFHIGEVNTSYLLKMIASMYALKMSFEIFATPFANALSNYLKRKEGFDLYDININYNPFKF